MTNQASKQFLFPKFNGISDSKFSGIAGSFFKCVGLDIHSLPGIIQPQQALAKVSAAVVTAFCRVSISCSTGDKLWFSYTDGKIWRQDTSDNFTLVYTTAPAADAAGCLGAVEFNGYVYWATQSRLHRTAITDIPAFAAVALNWQTFNVTDTEFHPMQVVQKTKLFIGDGNQVDYVDNASAYTANFFSILTPYRIKCMTNYNTDLVLGTIISQSNNECDVVRLDPNISPVIATYLEPVHENGINCFMQAGVHTLAQAGTAGNWYIYNGQTLIPLFRIPGTWTPTQFGEVYPSAVATFRGIPLFGLSNSPAAGNTTGNPADQGLYTYGSYSKNYPVVLNGPEYVISQNKVTSIEIGAILVEGNNLYVSWKDGANYGVDKVDWANKYASAYLESEVINLYAMFRLRINMPPPQFIEGISQFFADYAASPAGCSLLFSYKTNNAAAYTDLTVESINNTDNQQWQANRNLKGRDFQFKIAFTSSGNNGVQVENIGISVA